MVSGGILAITEAWFMHLSVQYLMCYFLFGENLSFVRAGTFQKSADEGFCIIESQALVRPIQKFLV